MSKQFKFNNDRSRYLDSSNTEDLSEFSRGNSKKKNSLRQHRKGRNKDSRDMIFIDTFSNKSCLFCDQRIKKSLEDFSPRLYS